MAGSENAVLGSVPPNPVLNLVVREGSSMRAAPFDIFRKDLLGTPVWMETVEDIETAKLRVQELLNRSPGEYFVLSQETEEIVIDTAPCWIDLIAQFRSSPESET